jgi:hypothetical protein
MIIENWIKGRELIDDLDVLTRLEERLEKVNGLSTLKEWVIDYQRFDAERFGQAFIDSIKEELKNNVKKLKDEKQKELDDL